MPPDSAKFPSGPTKVRPTSSAREAGIPNPLVSPVTWSLANVPDRMSLLTKKFDVSTRLFVAPTFSVTVVVIVGFVSVVVVVFVGGSGNRRVVFGSAGGVWFVVMQ